MNHAYGCDVSHWQGEVDFFQMREAGAAFVFLKASQAEWTDKRFVRNYQCAKDAGLLVGMYHYLDWSVPAMRQARYFGRLVLDYPPDIEPVLDYEERRNVPPQLNAIANARLFVDTVGDLTNAVCILYTSPGYWREFGRNSVTWEKHLLWIAHYNVSEPAIPAPWRDWLFWQYTDRGEGRKYGVSSAQIDLNRFNGTVDDLMARYNQGNTGQPTEPPPPVCSQPMSPIRLRVIGQVLNIRSGPAVSFARVGELRQGSEVTVEAIKVEGANRVWVKHAAGWSALVYDGKMFMQGL